MAISYLSSINLNKNQLQNGVIHVLATSPLNPVEGQIYYNSSPLEKKLYFYDGTNWIDASGDIKSVTTTTPNIIAVTDPQGPNPSLAIVTSAVTNGGTALATGDQIFQHVANSIGNISATINGTTNEIDVTTTGAGQTFGDGDTITVGLPNDVTVTNDLNVGNNLDVTGNAVIDGNLTVSGTTTTVNSNTVNIGDSIITLNSDEAGTPSQDAGIEVERGTGANRSLLWNETDDQWKIQQASGTYERIATYADSVEDVIVQETGSSGITVTETLSGTDNRIKTYDISVNLDDNNHKQNIGGVASYAFTHNLGTLDTIVQLVDSATYQTVYADIVRNSINQITVNFATAPAAGAIRVLVQKL